jgi:pimeloyl-ACP methyl ester carboxylesterase
MVRKEIARSLAQRLVLLSGLGLVLLVSAALAEEPKLEVESYLIPSADPGIQLYIRNKHPAGVTSYSADKILLYVHGATYPAETAFDLPLNGRSMMDYVAQQGFDVYLVDVRGYGGSTRPPEMEKPAAENGPIVDTTVAVKDVGAAVSHILQKRGVTKINLMGWSWGTAIMGMYTTDHNDRVNRLVLYAPLWIFTTRPLIGGTGPLGAYRTVTKEAAKQRWLNGVPESKKAELIPSGWFEQWADATWQTDPVGSKQTPPVARAPNGVLQDLRTYWTAGRYPRSDPDRPRRVGRRSAERSGAGLFRQIDQCALQALRRNRRGHPLHHHGEEPDAVLPRSHEFPERGGCAELELAGARPAPSIDGVIP